MIDVLAIILSLIFAGSAVYYYWQEKYDKGNACLLICILNFLIYKL